MKFWVSTRGGLVDAAEATVSVLDHGFTVADGVFETLKVVDGVPFALRRHLERLARSALALGLPAPDLAAVADQVARTVAANAGELGGRGRLRITLTGGEGALGSDRGTAEPTLVIAMAPLPTWPATAAVVTVPWPRNENGALAGVKSTSYAENVVALAHARRLGADEAIFADTRGRLCEGTGSNVGVVIDGIASMPTLATGCLAGITRELILEWCGVGEADHPIDILQRADEVFIASSTRDVQPVHLVDGRPLDAPGPVTRRIADEFAAGLARWPDP